MKLSTIPIGFPASLPSAVTQQSSSSELSDELAMALAAGRWWAIMEVSHPISEEPEYDFTSGQWRGAPEKVTFTSSLFFTPESEKSSNPGLSDSTQKSTEQERTCGQKKRQEAHVPALSFNEQHAPQRSQQRGKLIIPKHLKQHLQVAALQTPVPVKSPQDAPTPSAVTQQSSSSELSDELNMAPEKGAPTSSLFFTPESEKSSHSSLSDSTQKSTEQERMCGQRKRKEAHVPALSFNDPHVPQRPQQRGKLIIPEHLKLHLQKAALQTPVSAKSPQDAPIPLAVTQQSSSSELLDELNMAPEKGTPTSSQLLTHESEKSSHSSLSDSTQKSTEQERTCGQRKRKEAHVPALSFNDPHVPQRPQQRGKLIIPEHLKLHLKKAALQTPVPAKSPQDAPIPLAVTQQSSSSELSDELNMAPKKGSLTSSRLLTHESEKSSHSGLSDSTQKSTEQERTCRKKKRKEAHVPALTFNDPHVPQRPQRRGKLIIPEHLKLHLQKAALQTPVPAKSPQDVPIPLAVTQQSSSSDLSDELNMAPEKGSLTSSQLLTHESEKSSHSGLSDSTQKSTEQERMCRKKKRKEAHVPALSFNDPHVPQRPQQRGKLIIPEHLKGHLQKAALQTPVPGKSQEDAPISSAVTQQSSSSELSDELNMSPKKGALTSSRLLTYESEKSSHSGLSDSTQKSTEQERTCRKKKRKEAHVPALTFNDPHVPQRPQQRGKLIISEHLKLHLQKAALQTPVPAKSPQDVPIPLAVTQQSSSSELSDELNMSPKKGALTSSRLLTHESEKSSHSGLSDSTQRPVPAKSPQDAPKPTNLLHVKLEVSPVSTPQETTPPDKIQEKKSLKIHKPLSQRPKVSLLHGPSPSSEQGEPVHKTISQTERLKIQELRQEMLELIQSTQSLINQKITERRRLEISGVLRKELLELQQSFDQSFLHQFSFLQVLPASSQKRPCTHENIRRLKIREPLRSELLDLHYRHQDSFTQRSMPVKAPEEASPRSILEAALPSNVSSAPALFTLGEIPSAKVEGALVPAANGHGVHEDTGSKQHGANFSIVLKEHRQTWREQQHRQKRTPNAPQTASTTGTAVTRKRALQHSAGVDQSPIPKTKGKEIQDQPAEPSSLEQIEDLCRMFSQLSL